MPKDRTKDIISYKNKSNSSKLDLEYVKGCNTLWKCFKRSVWLHPKRPFLGERGDDSNRNLSRYLPKEEKNVDGEYQWQTFEETDLIVEALSNSLIKNKFCPVIKS